ncbi:UDP-N-acetylglucosamine 2-epimerase [Brevundimonas sp.]|uniref:UDP-N-acetylglucosamine 2-epimerase n=1 Tax=Brevundimonas sp. TaxID=1871086 RepID=UPI003784A6FE
MSVRARIGVFTATRAEYGLLRPVLSAMEASARLEPVLIVSGTHLSERHGRTLSEIEADGRKPAALVPVPLAGNAPADVAADMAAVLAGLGAAVPGLRLDALMVLGDRTEVLAAAAAGVPFGLPILHLEGGHRTTGAVDDAIRHAVTKLSALHFTAAEPYRQRILQLGEAGDRVFTVGSTAVETIRAARTDRATVARMLEADLEPGFLLVTFHPETLAAMSPADQVAAFLGGLGTVRDRKLVITRPNADVGSDAVRAALDAFAAERPDQVLLNESLGAARYAAALTACDAVVGNSSSGVIEAPIAGVPSVNVGGRQDGRIKPPSVVDCANTPSVVAEALARALDPAFAETARSQPAPFGEGGAARLIVETLEQTTFCGLARKSFVDRP